MENNFHKLAKLSLVLIYIVIMAGAFVRMTGSGMGCPDWPKCFGFYIPPTEKSQILFKSNSDYKKGQMIIYNQEELLVAKSDFKSETSLNLNNWEVYEKHDYVIFNPVHTWIEYINRLIGAISGIPIKPETVNEENLAPVTKETKIEAKVEAAPAVDVKKEESPKVETVAKPDKKPESSPEKK